MNNLFANIILFDTSGIAYTGDDLDKKGMGASESQAIFLLEEFAKLNYKVICLNNTNIEKEVNGVLYLSNTNIQKFDFKCDHLILHRNSIIPKNIKNKKCYQWVTDNNTHFNLSYYNLIENNKCKLITLSQYSADQYPQDWNKHVINFMIPDWVYDYKISEKKSDYVYASSIMKGYESTINYWMYMKNTYESLNNKSLNVCLPGYDNPNFNLNNKNYQINYFGTLTFKQVVELLSQSEGLFYVNTMQETFCVTAVLAEILKATPFILCLNGYGALKEVLNSETVCNNSKEFFENILLQKKDQTNIKSYRSKNIIEKWQKIINEKI
jgi:hypothetical protein